MVFCCLFFAIEVLWVPYIFWTLTPYQCGLQMFSPFCRFPCSFCWLFLWLCWSFYVVWCSPNYLFLLLVVCALGVTSKKSLLRPVSRGVVLPYWSGSQRRIDSLVSNATEEIASLASSREKILSRAEALDSFRVSWATEGIPAGLSGRIGTITQFFALKRFAI